MERFDANAHYFYWGNGVLVITAESVGSMCADEPVPATAMGIHTGNGGGQFKLHADVPVLVFADDRFDSADPFIGFIFLDEVCGQGADYDLIAAGDGLRLRVSEQIDADGTVHSENSVVGKVQTSDGGRAHVTTHASVVFNGPELIKLNPFFVKYTG